MEKCTIISGGEYSPLNDLDKESFIIACDKGLSFATLDGITPSLALGDFDSYDGALYSNVKTLVLPAEKDDTDTMYAIRYAVENGAKQITLTCALGGRVDHLLGNLQSCLYAVDCGVDICIKESDCEIYFIKNGKKTFKNRDGYVFSVLSVTKKSSGVSIKGAKYPLKNVSLSYAYPLGVSNQWSSDSVTVKVRSGVLAVILTASAKI